LVTEHTSSPLIFGSAVHYGCGIFLTTGSESRATKAAETEVKKRETEYENYEDYRQDLFRAPILVGEWIRKLGKGYRNNFDTVISEKEIRVPIPGTDGFFYTMIPDAVIANEDMAAIVEIKTSSSSWKLTDLGVRTGDQATSYLWGVSEKYPFPIDGVLPNILYWNKKAYNETNINVFQSELVTRTRKDIEELKWGLAQLVTEISQKIATFKSGKFPAPMLFPRNTYYCNAFFRPCEYAEICRRSLSLKGRAPGGFRREAARRKITDPMEN
jgi:hypothetical protein